MTIDYKFTIGQEVMIKELGLKGKVIALFTGRRGNEINVRYCSNGKYDDIYFYEDELEVVTE